MISDIHLLATKAQGWLKKQNNTNIIQTITQRPLMSSPPSKYLKHNSDIGTASSKENAKLMMFLYLSKNKKINAIERRII